MVKNKLSYICIQRFEFIPLSYFKVCELRVALNFVHYVLWKFLFTNYVTEEFVKVDINQVVWMLYFLRFNT